MNKEKLNEEMVIEAALLTTSEAMTNKDLKKIFEPPLQQDKLNKILENLNQRWSDRALSLVETHQGWRFQVSGEIVYQIPHLVEQKNPRYSRAVMETLAIIAYRQPVTRAEVEEVRGVSVSSQIIHTLVDRGWICVVGTKEVPGRPSLWGTTSQFLSDLCLTSLDDLPSLEELGELMVNID